MPFQSRLIRQSLRRGLPAAIGVWTDGFAIEAEAGCAVDVCGESSDLGGLKCFEDFVAGMAVAVVESTGDDGPPRGDVRQKLRAGGG